MNCLNDDKDFITIDFYRNANDIFTKFFSAPFWVSVCRSNFLKGIFSLFARRAENGVDLGALVEWCDLNPFFEVFVAG